jgi:hypothetical protein
MKKLLTALFAIILISQSAWSQISGTAIAFVHVAVVDVRSGEIKSDMTVLLSKNRISKVGPSKTIHIPKNARTIDARGKYLIPGLWDMHVHSLWDADRPPLFFPLFLANGVTGVREICRHGSPKVRWRNEVESAAVLGPRLVVPGPFVDGPHPIWPGSIKVSTEEDGRQAGRQLTHLKQREWIL